MITEQLKNTTKKRKFDSIQQEAYLSLWRTYDRLKAIEDHLFDHWDMTPQQYNVLRLLEASHPNPIPTLSLSNRLVSRAPDITRMLDKLEKSQWIERVRSVEDRRAVLVTVTSKGKKLLREIAQPLSESHVAQMGHLSGQELKQLCDLLRKVRQPHEPNNSDW
ncbi:MAG: MarR family winged helix-turn-helix transcriptional regulator [Pirellula staleyi]